MSIVAEFRLPAREFFLASAVQSVPGVHVEIERMVVDGLESSTPYFWVTGDAVEAFEDALDDDITVADVKRLDTTPDGRFYRATWRERVRGILYAIAEETATIMAATCDAGTWNMRMLFADQASLSNFHDYCAVYDVGLSLERLYDPSNPDSFGRYEVTGEQEEILREALEAGYFAVPREISLEELADRVGISSNAASARLRRGHANLIRNTLDRTRDTDASG